MTIKYLFASFFILFLIASCTKISETEIGTGLIPPVDGVIVKDTNITIYAKNASDIDTVRPSLFEDHALGYVNDPLFGITTAAVYVQMQPTSFPFSFGAGSDSLILDSVVLALDVRGAWGDTAQPLSLHVKELSNNQTFTSDSGLIIYNNTSAFATTNDLTYNGAAPVFPTAVNDSFHVYQDSGVNMLRIRLTDEFGNRLLHTYDSSHQYSTDSAFRAAFKGFEVSADAVGNSLLRIGLANNSGVAEPNTKLAVYYKIANSAGTKDTAVTYFTINPATSAHSNFINRNKSMAQIATYYPPKAGQNDEYVYMQSGPGTFATITIDSGISRLPNLIIHRAEIVMEQAPDAASPLLDNFTTPYLFLLVKPDNNIAFQNDTSKFLIPGFDPGNVSTYDALFTFQTAGSLQVLANYSEFGGIPLRKTSEGVAINYYNFNVSRYIQGIVTNKNPQYSFTLYTPYREVFGLTNQLTSFGRVTSSPVNSAAIGRVKLYGGGDYNANPHRMKLHIVYSVPH